jgi:2-iminobutanoate/2-iminopropanoate deaminase
VEHPAAIDRGAFDCEHSTMNRELRPETMAPPAAAYAHGIEVPAGARLVFTSGVVPARPDGTIPTSIGEQAALVWHNIAAILSEGNMGVEDIVSLTTYVVATAGLSDDLREVMSARDTALRGHLAASTLVTVPALARPEWKMEISVIAAKS